MQFKHLLTFCFFALTCLFVQPAMAQNKVITGKVTDKKDGSTLIGVSVGAAGGVGTLTGVDGTFRLSVPSSTASLNFSYIGYKSQTVQLTGTTVNVSLESSSTSLNEVVVLGYGSQRVKDATGSVASLSTKDFNKGVISTPEQLLQGRIAGVQVTPASGEPGAAASINIRGTSSIRAGNNPLYVIDGVPLDAGGTSGGFDSNAGSSSARNPLAFLNPADIENISVLKDASSAAIYGSRGANGVILITTRKGRKGQGIQFGASTSIANVAKRYDLLTRQQFLDGVDAVGAVSSAVDLGGNTDWQNEIFRQAVSQNYNLAFGGGGDRGNYRASFSYDDQNGTVKTSNLKRLTGRLNASEAFFNNFLKLDLNFTASNVKNRYALITNNAGFQGSLIGAALQANPTYPVYNPDGTYFSVNGFRNPVALLNLVDDADNINRYLTNLAATFNITKNIFYKASGGYDYSTGLRKTFFDPTIPAFTDGSGYRNFNIDPATGNGRAIYQNQKLLNFTIEHTLNYDKKWADNSQLTVLGGYSYYSYKNYSENRIGFGVPTGYPYTKDINNFRHQLPYPTGDSSRTELQSFFARAFYSYKDRFLFTATVRTDGSSRFGKNNKYATFPALSVKWKLMNESFMPKNGIFNDLAVRVNYGKTGNQEFPPYSSLAVNQLQYNNSLVTLNPASPNLKWETTEAYGIGIDFAMFNNRLTGSVDYFNKGTKDLLFFQDYAQPSAFARRWVNLPGTVKNTGVDMIVNYAAVQGNKFSWDVSYNMTLLKNRMTNFGNANVITGNIDGQGLSGAYSQVITNGQPLFSFKVGKFTGYDDQGFNKDPAQIDQPKIVGSAIPSFSAGLTNNFTYGQFNLNVFINGSAGFYIYNNTANAYFLKGNLVSGRNVTKEVAASPENPLNSGEVSTRFLEKGDFIRLSNVSLGYTFKMAAQSKIRTLRLSVTGQNLALITGYSGLDPEINTNKARNEVPSRGIDYTSYPSSRIFTLGLNAGF